MATEDAPPPKSPEAKLAASFNPTTLVAKIHDLEQGAKVEEAKRTRAERDRVGWLAGHGLGTLRA